MAVRRTKEYRIWEGIMQRCTNPKNTHYSYYGGRGITVCDSWKSFKNFFQDMGYRPAGLSLDRVNPDLGYFKENCRWVDWKTQSINKRKQKRNKSGVIGVDITPKGRFVASIRSDKKKVYLGTFDTVAEAAEVRKKAELQYYGFNVNEK